MIASRFHCALLLNVWVIGGGLTRAVAAEPAKPVSTAAIQTALAQGDLDKATKLATDLIAEHPGEILPLRIRARINVEREQFAAAVPDLEAAVKLDPTADAINYLGTIRYQAGQLKEALADFDRAIKLDPQLEKSHWQRGIVYYDLGEWENGRKQFEQYQGFYDNDVENVVWRAMCMARDPNLGWKKAAGDLWKVKHDRRVPLMVVAELFADKATPEDVLKAVDEGNPRGRTSLTPLLRALVPGSLSRSPRQQRRGAQAPGTRLGQIQIAGVHGRSRAGACGVVEERESHEMKCRHCGLRYPANCYSPYPDSFASPGQIFVVSIAFAILAASLLYFGQILWMWISLGKTLFVLFVTMMTVMYCNGMIDKFWARIRNEERIETKQTGEYCPDCQQFNRIYPWSF